MDRRTFVRLLGAAGAAAGLPRVLRPAPARAVTSATAKPMLFCLEAEGAYDVTLICDPRGNGGQSNPPNHGYSPADIVTYGNLQVAPQVPAVASFFSQYHGQTLVINGVDTSTIDHATGARSSMTGMSSVGYPSTAAVIAAALDPTLPAAYMSNGGANTATPQTGLTLLGPGISNALLTSMDGGGVHSQAVWAGLQDGMAERLARRTQAAQSTIRRQRDALMAQSFAGAGQLGQLSQTIANLGISVPLANPSQSALTVDAGNALSVQVALAGYLHGQTSTAQMVVGSFDTHTSNDQGQTALLTTLFSLADYILRGAAYLGLSDKILIFIASDFSRTPFYNTASAGKDHWPTTSAILINPSSAANMPVGTVVGGSDSGLNPLTFDPASLQASASGVTIKPGHIHDALRRWYGIDQSAVASAYPLHMSENLSILG